MLAVSNQLVTNGTLNITPHLDRNNGYYITGSEALALGVPYDAIYEGVPPGRKPNLRIPLQLLPTISQ